MTGITFTLIDWILVAIEMLFVVISATFSSTLSTEIFQVKPESKQYLLICPKPEPSNKIPFIDIDDILLCYPSFMYIDLYRMLTDPYFSSF
jgi:hypothetical protein